MNGVVLLSVNILFSYFVLGITLAAPIGPVNSARLDKGLKNGFWHAWIVGLGAMIADAIFMMMVYVGLVKFLDIPIVQTFLWLFGGFVLLYSGIEGMFAAKKLTIDYRSSPDSMLKCFMVGFIMSITSPLSILFWLGIYGSVLAKTAVTYGTSSLLVYTLMMFIGLTCWDFFVAALTTVFRKYLNETSIKVISVFSGLSLVGFGVYFGYQGITALLG